MKIARENWAEVQQQRNKDNEIAAKLIAEQKRLYEEKENLIKEFNPGLTKIMEEFIQEQSTACDEYYYSEQDKAAEVLWSFQSWLFDKGYKL
jgi:pyruvate-formate lyase